MKLRRALGPMALALLATTATRASRAGYVGEIDGAPVRLEITETSIGAWHIDNRNQKTWDDGYGEWINHLNVVLAWKAWQAGVRLDTATYFNTPARGDLAPGERNAIYPYHFRDQYLLAPGVPAKMYVTYASPKLEATLGDAYVAFGRGLVLSIRKVDELAVDTSLQGAKVVGRLAPFTLTGVVGLSNPVRIDEASGAALRDADPSVIGRSQVGWTRDVITGGRAEAKLGTTTVGIHAADVIRDRSGLPGPLKGYDWNTDPNGPFTETPTLKAKQIQAIGASIAVPKLSDAFPLNLYLEWAMQHRVSWENVNAPESGDKARGVAAYGAASYTAGIVTTTLEGKHYRGFYAIPANLNRSYYSDFAGAIVYNAPPSVELITQDSLFDNSCTSGGRARVDVRPKKGFAVFASGAYFANWGEQGSLPTACYQGSGFGLTHNWDPAKDSAETKPLRNDIYDGYAGFELRSQRESSYVLATGGVRRDTKAQGPAANEGDFYHETWLQFDAVKMLDADWAIELQGWHRNRYEKDHGWREGEDYLSLKRGSKQAFYVGHEYTSDPAKVKAGAPLTSGGHRNADGQIVGATQHYLNVGAQFRFSDAVQLRVFAGQQRPALKCVAGVCRNFPAFEGAKAEIVVRY
jgi:hypothetical protein